MQLYRSRLRRPRFTLAEVAGLVAGVALALRWPILLMPTLSVALILFLDRLGLSLILAFILTSVVWLVLGLSLPLIVFH
jgi:phage shock protein PspC (stress-responsive transcriptional regulator)